MTNTTSILLCVTLFLLKKAEMSVNIIIYMQTFSNKKGCKVPKKMQHTKITITQKITITSQSQTVSIINAILFIYYIEQSFIL